MAENTTVLTLSPLREVIEHWARARIDTPLNLIGRYDEGARQVLGLTAVLQGAYVALLSFGDLASRMHPFLMLLVVLALVPAMFSALRCICTVSAEMEAMKAYRLVEAVTAGRASSSDVEQAVHVWCVEVDRLVARKRSLLHVANLAFLAGSAFAAATIIYLQIP